MSQPQTLLCNERTHGYFPLRQDYAGVLAADRDGSMARAGDSFECIL